MKNAFQSRTHSNTEVPLSQAGNLNILYGAVSVAGEPHPPRCNSPAMQFLKNALQCPRELWTLPSRR